MLTVMFDYCVMFVGSFVCMCVLFCFVCVCVEGLVVHCYFGPIFLL